MLIYGKLVGCKIYVNQAQDPPPAKLRRPRIGASPSAWLMPSLWCGLDSWSGVWSCFIWFMLKSSARGPVQVRALRRASIPLRALHHPLFSRGQLDRQHLRQNGPGVSCSSFSTACPMPGKETVLVNVLKELPVYFINMVDKGDVAAAWLQRQPSILHAESQTLKWLGAFFEDLCG